MNTAKFLWMTFLLSLNLAASTQTKPSIAIILADWGMQEALHNELEPTLHPSYTLALHFLGKKTVATGLHTLLIQIPTLKECQQAKTLYETLPDHVRKRTQGVWIEDNDGASAYPPSPIQPYLVFSQPPLHPNPPKLGDNAIMGHFWVPTSLPLAERQKIYTMSHEYAKKAGSCTLSITIANKETWEHFQQWANSLKDTVQWITLTDYMNLRKTQSTNAPKSP